MRIDYYTVSENKVRTNEQVKPASQNQYPIHLIEMPDNIALKYQDWELQLAQSLIQRLINTRTGKEEVLVLARTNYPLNRLEVQFPYDESQR
jgi:hypothetical protein